MLTAAHAAGPQVSSYDEMAAVVAEELGLEVRREPRGTRACPIKHQRFAWYGARTSECSGLCTQEVALSWLGSDPAAPVRPTPSNSRCNERRNQGKPPGYTQYGSLL